MTRRIRYIFGLLFLVPYPTGHSEKSSIILFHETVVFNKRSGAVAMSPDSEGLGAAVVAGVGSTLTQPSGVSYFSPPHTHIYMYMWHLTAFKNQLVSRFLNWIKNEIVRNINSEKR